MKHRRRVLAIITILPITECSKRRPLVISELKVRGPYNGSWVVLSKTLRPVQKEVQFRIR